MRVELLFFSCKRLKTMNFKILKNVEEIRNRHGSYQLAFYCISIIEQYQIYFTDVDLSHFRKSSKPGL